ncbi:MAG TPA: site-specific integrase [Victivallales bacterium]|nr:site-specific integrase [Victivallales bacterium]
MKRINFTKNNLDRLNYTGIRIEYQDKKFKHLTIRVSKFKKTFNHLVNISGTTKRIQLGHYPYMSIVEARKASCDNIKQDTLGQNPNNLKYENLYNQYVKDKGIQKASHVKYYYKYYSDRFLMIPAFKITKQDVKDIFYDMTETHGKHTANRVVGSIGTVFNYCIKEEIIEFHNPVRYFKFHTEHKRKRFVKHSEMKNFFTALEESTISEQNRDIIKCLLFAGTRKNNVLQMKWADLDLISRNWYLQYSEIKNDDDFTCTLSKPVVEILKRRREAEKKDPIYVFPSETGIGHVTDIKKAWWQVRKTFASKDRLKLILEYKEKEKYISAEDLGRFNDERNKALNLFDREHNLNNNTVNLRIHDLRRTLASWQAINGSSLLVIGKSLGHKDTSSTEIYAHLNNETVRKSVDNAVDSMFKIINEDPSKKRNFSKIDELKGFIASIEASDESEFKMQVLKQIVG